MKSGKSTLAVTRVVPDAPTMPPFRPTRLPPGRSPAPTSIVDQRFSRMSLDVTNTPSPTALRKSLAASSRRMDFVHSTARPTSQYRIATPRSLQPLAATPRGSVPTYVFPPPSPPLPPQQQPEEQEERGEAPTDGAAAAAAASAAAAAAAADAATTAAAATATSVTTQLVEQLRTSLSSELESLRAELHIEKTARAALELKVAKLEAAAAQRAAKGSRSSNAHVPLSALPPAVLTGDLSPWHAEEAPGSPTSTGTPESTNSFRRRRLSVENVLSSSPASPTRRSSLLRSTTLTRHSPLPPRSAHENGTAAAGSGAASPSAADDAADDAATGGAGSLKDSPTRPAALTRHRTQLNVEVPPGSAAPLYAVALEMGQTPPETDAPMPSFISSNYGSFSCHGAEPADGEPGAMDKINQDCACVAYDVGGLCGTALFCVYDGHGDFGDAVSTEALRAMHAHLQASAAELTSAPTAALVDAFETVHARLEVLATKAEVSVDARDSGACALVAYMHGSSLLVAGAGDCRAVLGTTREGVLSAVALSTDHRVDLPAEQARILASGGWVRPAKGEGDDYVPARMYENQHAPWLGPGLTVARSIGDLNAMRCGLVATPEVCSHEVDPETDRFLVLGSDGLWEFLRQEDAIHIVDGYFNRGEPPLEACRYLIAKAALLWREHEGDYRDDITATVVYLPPLVQALEKQLAEPTPERVEVPVD